MSNNYELVYRSTKGSPVTPDEVDGNFRKIKTGHDTTQNLITNLENKTNGHKNQISGLAVQLSQFEGRVSTLRVDLDEQTEKLAQEAKKLNDLILEGLGGVLDVNVSVDLSNHYTKSETDTAIQTALNNINLSNYYTKTEVYNKVEVDAKIDSGNVFDPTQYYKKTEVDGLIPTTFSGDYNDLSNKPTLPDLTPYALKTEIPTTFSGDYNDLSNKPYVPTEELINTMVQDIYDLNAETFPDKLPTPVINITPTAATLLEAGEVSNQVITFTILAQNTIFSEPLTWNISGTNIDTDDFASVELDGEPIDISSLSGSISDSTQSHTLKVTIARDEKSEGGNEVFTLTVSHNRNGSITVTERDVTIIDNSLDSEIRSVSWGGPDSGSTLFEHLRDTANSNMWVQDFDISELKISTEEKAQLKEDALELDYTTLISNGITINDVRTIVDSVIEESVSVLNAVVDATFGTESTVIVDSGTMHFITHDTDTLEARPSNNRLYIRNSAAAYIDVVYAETYNIADVNAQVETFVDTYLAEFDWSSVGLTGTVEEIQQVKDIILAFTGIVIPLVIDVAQAMSTTVNLYGYRKLTAGS